jgi:hypothetical protein
MTTIQRFEDLEIWKKSRLFSEKVRKFKNKTANA